MDELSKFYSSLKQNRTYELNKSRSSIVKTGTQREFSLRKDKAKRSLLTLNLKQHKIDNKFW